VIRVLSIQPIKKRILGQIAPHLGYPQRKL
jgi:hypothetical protein